MMILLLLFWFSNNNGKVIDFKNNKVAHAKICTGRIVNAGIGLLLAPWWGGVEGSVGACCFWGEAYCSGPSWWVQALKIFNMRFKKYLMVRGSDSLRQIVSHTAVRGRESLKALKSQYFMEPRISSWSKITKKMECQEHLLLHLPHQAALPSGLWRPSECRETLLWEHCHL